MAGRRGADVWLPAEHGAWAMLLIPLVAGVALVGAAPVHLPLAVAWLAGYPAFSSGSAWLRARRRDRDAGRTPAPPPRPFVVLGAVTLIALAITVAVAPGLVRWSTVFVPLLTVSLVEVVRGRPRSLLNDAVTTGAASLMLLVAVDAGGGTLDGSTVVAWSAVLAYFLGTALAVKTLIRERGSRAHLAASLVWHALLVVVALTPVVTDVLGPGGAVLAVMLLVRAAVGPTLDARRRRPLRPVAIGMVEVVLSLVLLVVVLAAPAGAAAAEAAEGGGTDHATVTVVAFVVEGCPFCARMEAFLADLADFVGPAMVVERIDVDADPEGRERWHTELRARGVEPGRVPAVVIDELVWVGVDDRIEQAIVSAVLERTGPPEVGAPEPAPRTPEPAPTPDVGETPAQVDSAGRSTRRIVVAAVVVLGLGAATVGVRSRSRAGRPSRP